MDPDPLDVLDAQYPAWRMWRGVRVNGGLLYAWLLRSSPPIVLRDRSVRGLWARVDEFERVHKGDPPQVLGRTPAAALAAAEALDTTTMQDPELRAAAPGGVGPPAGSLTPTRRGLK